MLYILENSRLHWKMTSTKLLIVLTTFILISSVFTDQQQNFKRLQLKYEIPETLPMAIILKSKTFECPAGQRKIGHICRITKS